MSDAVQDKPRIRRSVKILLFVSLALNLLVAGLVIGAVAGHRDGRLPRADQGPGGPMVAALSHADRRAIGRSMRAELRGSRPTRAAVRAEYQVVIDALRAVPYDPSAVQTAVDRQMELMSERALLGKTMLLRRLEEMSEGERAAYAERLQGVLERGPGRGGRSGGQ